MENRIILSICIPTYDRAEYLRQCVESIVKQFDNLDVKNAVEIVISDNNSTDHTASVVREFAEKFDNIRYFRNEINIGFDLNVVNVVKQSTTKYCWYLGDDDVIVSGAILFILSKLNSCNYDVITVEGETIIDSNNDSNPLSLNISDDYNRESKDFNEFYFNGYCRGIFSYIIFDRDLWLSCLDADDYLEYWLYFETVVKILTVTEKKMLNINLPIVLTRQDCRWASNGTELFTFINYIILTRRMLNFGFDKAKIMQELSDDSKNIVIMLLRAKGHGLKCSWNNYKFMIKNCHPFGYRCLIMPSVIFPVPNMIIRWLRDFRKYLMV